VSRCGEAPAGARRRLASASSFVHNLPAALYRHTSQKPCRVGIIPAVARSGRSAGPGRGGCCRYDSDSGTCGDCSACRPPVAPRATPRDGTAPTYNRSASIYPSAAPANDGATTAPSGASPASDAYGTTPAHTHAATAKPRLDDVRVFFCCGSDPSTLVERRAAAAGCSGMPTATPVSSVRLMTPIRRVVA
jgi:hypothetical protein